MSNTIGPRLGVLSPYRKNHLAIKHRDIKIQWAAVIIPVVTMIMLNRLTFGTLSIPTLFINKSYLKSHIKDELIVYAKLLSAVILTYVFMPLNPMIGLLWMGFTEILLCRSFAYFLYNFLKSFEENQSVNKNIDYLKNKLPNCISKHIEQ